MQKGERLPVMLEIGWFGDADSETAPSCARCKAGSWELESGEKRQNQADGNSRPCLS